jgi:hypothetical protein
MEQSSTVLHCLNCGRSEQDVPLVNLRYGSETRWICSQCFPLLIHHPERLSGKLPHAEQIAAAADEH